MSRRPLKRAPSEPSPLTPDEVFGIVAAHAHSTPLSTAAIAEFCRSRWPEYPGITTHRVNRLLQWLHRRRRVDSWSGAQEAALDQRGVAFASSSQRQRYWALAAECAPASAGPTTLE